MYIMVKFTSGGIMLLRESLEEIDDFREKGAGSLNWLIFSCWFCSDC